MNMWKSSDFYLCVCVLASGVDVLSIDRTSPKRAIFTFNCSKESGDEIVDSHWCGNLQLSSRKVMDSINQLKTMIYQLT